MDAKAGSSRVLAAAVARLLRPLFRVLLRQSMSFGEFEELAKRVYVDVAMKEFAIEGKKPLARLDPLRPDAQGSAAPCRIAGRA
jgi:Family of unknown function (DUF6502)